MLWAERHRSYSSTLAPYFSTVVNRAVQESGTLKTAFCKRSVHERLPTLSDCIESAVAPQLV